MSADQDKTENKITESIYSFPDGDLYILSAPDASGERNRYKVHKTILAAFSGTFNDMFSLPAPSNDETESSAEEMPTIHIDEDPYIIEAVLSFIYANRGINQYNLRDQSTERLVETAIFCDKYHIASLQSAIENYLLEYLDRYEELGTITGDYQVDFEANDIIRLFNYGYNTNNKAIIETAGTAITRFLNSRAICMMDIKADLDVLSGPALYDVWRTQYKRVLISSIEARQELVVSERRSKKARLLLQLPQVDVQHADKVCFKRGVASFWLQVVGEHLAPANGGTGLVDVVLKDVVRDLRKANDPTTCMVCAAAAERRCLENLAWKWRS